MHEKSAVQNCKNTTTGAITVSGSMYIYGGTVRNNECNYGGVYVKAGGKLFTYGGVIADNKSATSGDAVYSLGKVTRVVQTYSTSMLRRNMTKTATLSATELPNLSVAPFLISNIIP